MPAVAEVQFKAQGSQQVVTAFNSVGSAAQTSATKVQQNSTAMKSMGQGMKSTVSGIGQAATAFATLSLSVVATWRAYRDLGDAQIAVDKANLRVKKTTEAIRKSEAEVAKLKKESAKGGLEQVAATHKIQLMEQKLAADRKSGKKTALELRVQEDAINLARKEGVPSSKKLMDAENKLALQKEQLGVQTDVAKEAQERFNDTQQNFYLSIAPLAISTVGTLATAFSGLKGMLTGGGGLVAGLGPIGLILGGITLAIIAFKTNFLGLRDAVGGVIDWIKERFGVWKQAIEDVFSFIKAGDWGMAFNRIKDAAAKFWEDLVKTVPFFGTVSDIIDKIKKGDWAGAFNIIATAAETAWKTLVAKVPFFGGVATLIDQIKKGDWKGAFNTIAAAFQTAVGMIGGEKLILKFQLIRDTAIAEFGLMQHELTKKGGPFDLIQQGLAKLGSGDIVGGFSQIWTGIDKAIGIAIARFTDWIKLNFGVDLNQVYSKALEIGNKILDGIKGGLTFIARTWIDPFLASLFNLATWEAAGNAVLSTITAIGTSIFNFLAGAIGDAAKDPKGTATFWSDIGNSIWTGIVTWMADNLPDTLTAMQTFAQGFVDAVISTGNYFKIAGMEVWNQFVNGIKAGLADAAVNINPFSSGLFHILGVTADQIKNDPKFQKMWTFDVNAEISKQHQEDLKKQLAAVAKSLSGGATVGAKSGTTVTVGIDGNPQELYKITKQAVANINKMHATITVSARVVGWGDVNAAARRLQTVWGGGKQHGYQGTVKRPTTFIAGEGGRPEDVTVRPRGSVQRGGGGGGGFYGTVNVYVDGVLRPARYSMGARK